MGHMKIMTTGGDEHLTWNPEDETSVQTARDRFNELRDQGHKAYEVQMTTTRTGSPVKEFEASVKEYLLVPQLSGG